MTVCEQSGHSITLHVIGKAGISLSMHVHGCYKLHFAFLTRTLSVLGVTIYNLKMGEMYIGRISKEAVY